MAACTPILAILVYVIVGRLLVRRRSGGWRQAAFALLNLGGICYFYLAGEHLRHAVGFAIYVVLVVFQYATMRLFSESRGWRFWLAFFTPIVFLVVLRYFPPSTCAGLSAGLRGILEKDPGFTFASLLIGVSYLAFRASHLVLEVRNGAVKKPGFWEYLGFCFFLPTLSVGPINTFSNHHRAFAENPPPIPVGRAALRVAIGYVKYKFLGAFFNQLGYSNLLFDDHPHHWIDLPVAMVFYYLFLYCNFSGFCDMAIGGAGLMGVPVAENFANPLAARNMREFWNRWHITLSTWMRDLVFSPLSKLLVRRVGPARSHHAVAFAILVTFLLIGIWHGVGWNYAAFGLAQALGVVTVHYYTLFLKKRLGRDGFKAYNQNRWIRAAGVVITFSYYAATLFLFANTFSQMRAIFSLLR
jgi:D-alanyl-lipoteichoic acid acyltransferase DltB (MBOAT superfamily)